MRESEKLTTFKNHSLFDVNYHSFLERDSMPLNAMEIASEFGITLGEVRKLRKALHKR